jgi:hypothetical protein
MGRADAPWRVLVRIGPGQPELVADLGGLRPRARAERLRQLALVGLYCLRHGAAAATAETPPQDPALAARRERLLRGLLGEGD